MDRDITDEQLKDDSGEDIVVKTCKILVSLEESAWNKVFWPGRSTNNGTARAWGREIVSGASRSRIFRPLTSRHPQDCPDASYRMRSAAGGGQVRRYWWRGDAGHAVIRAGSPKPIWSSGRPSGGAEPD